jgi:hypothetical protein
MSKKKNEMLEKIQQQPSSVNLSSNVKKAEGMKPSETLSDVKKDIKKQGGLVQVLSGKGDYRWKNTRITEDKRLLPENIKKQIKHNKEMDELLEGARKFQEEQDKIIKQEKAIEEKALKKPKSKIPSDAVYDSSGKITDLSGKPYKFTKLKSVLGILPAAAAAALAAYSPDSKATTVAKTVARIADEGDPTSFLFPEGAGEGEDEEVMRMKKEAEKNRYLDNLMKNVPKNEKARSELETEVEPIVKILGGEPDMKPSRASKLAGEKSSPDLEEMDNSVNYEDYLKKKKRQLGY